MASGNVREKSVSSFTLICYSLPSVSLDPWLFWSLIEKYWNLIFHFVSSPLIKIFDVVKFKKTGKWLLINKKQHMVCYSTSYDHSKWRLQENDHNFYNL